MKSSSGNALLYVLIAVILLGALSFTISRSGDNNPSGEISDAAAKTAATSILAYEAQAKAAVNQMIMNGTKVTDIVYTMPWESTFNDAPTTAKLFHPDGGGLQWKPLPDTAKGQVVNPTPGYSLSSGYKGYYVGRFNNVGWSPSSSLDIVFSAFGLKDAVCKELNRRLTGISATYTVGAGESPRRLFVPSAYHTGGQNDITATTCPNCENKNAFCIIDTYYSILYAR